MASEKDKKKSSKDPRTWDALKPPLPDWIQESVSSMGFTRATPVQASVWPLFGGGNKDVVVEAVTGSGKTLAFLIPLVYRILRQEPTKRHHIAAIVIAPTRELASQIHGTLAQLVAFHSTSSEVARYLDGEEKRPSASSSAIVPQLLSGGSTTTTAQDLSFFLRHSPNFIISTPGRLVELLSSPHVHCTQANFEALVLDEADRLLDLGFKSDLQNVLSRLPKQRRTGLFSASVSEAVGEIIRVGLRNPVKIVVRVKSSKTGGIVEEKRTPASLRMTYCITPAHRKFPTLFRLLESLRPNPVKTMVFLSTCASVDYFSNILPSLLPEAYSMVPLHGKYDAKVRQKNLARFVKATEPSVLLTTDVGARGLDLPQVDLVVQIDSPADPKTFLHRCGRAGRAGRKGLSVIFLTDKEEDYVHFLEVRKTPILPLVSPDITVEDADAAEVTRRIRNIVQHDRAHHDRGQKAFPSFVRSYSKHQASSIFRVKDIDWISLANAFGLLRLPKMPELKGFQGDRSLGLQIDWEEYAYQSKAREKQRQTAVKPPTESAALFIAKTEEAEAHRTKRKRNAEAWSDKHEKEETRMTKRDKKKRKREAVRKDHLTEAEKNKEMDLERLLIEVRSRNRAKYAKQQASARVDECEDFEGFG